MIVNRLGQSNKTRQEHIARESPPISAKRLDGASLSKSTRRLAAPEEGTLSSFATRSARGSAGTPSRARVGVADAAQRSPVSTPCVGRPLRNYPRECSLTSNE